MTKRKRNTTKKRMRLRTRMNVKATKPPLWCFLRRDGAAAAAATTLTTTARAAGPVVRGLSGATPAFVASVSSSSLPPRPLASPSHPPPPLVPPRRPPTTTMATMATMTTMTTIATMTRTRTTKRKTKRKRRKTAKPFQQDPRGGTPSEELRSCPAGPPHAEATQHDHLARPRRNEAVRRRRARHPSCAGDLPRNSGAT